MSESGLGQEMPVYGCQVLVQSEEEKAIRRQMRKEEKKLNKMLNKASDTGNGSDQESDGQDFRFDPIDLRTKRQAALANAISQPLLKEAYATRSDRGGSAGSSGSYLEQLPYVYDSYAKAKLAPGMKKNIWLDG